MQQSAGNAYHNYKSFLVDEVQNFIALGNRQQATGNIGINSLITVPHYAQKCCNL
ncbi:MAG: hypothetical protein SWX82_12515 [Cyanobacteriota bacterium]|nr:hypothetical protein [Cyanobacteriota bacterium]